MQTKFDKPSEACLCASVDKNETSHSQGRIRNNTLRTTAIITSSWSAPFCPSKMYALLGTIKGTRLIRTFNPPVGL